MSIYNAFNTTTQPARLIPPEEISATFDEIINISEAVDTFGDRVEAEISKINPDLTDAAKAKEITKLRSQFAAETKDRVATLAGLRDQLVAQAPNYSPLAVKARAYFGTTQDEQASAALGSFVLARAAAAPLHVLVELARDAASRYDLASCLAIEGEAQKRAAGSEPSEVIDEITALCNSVPLPPAVVAASQKIADGYGVAELARVKVEERIAGASKPAERMTVAFAAAKLTGKPSLPVASAA